MVSGNETTACVLQLMMAVQYLHSIGVAHRDVKLENVLLSKDGVRLRLTDFGLAARLDEWEDSSGGGVATQVNFARMHAWPIAGGRIDFLFLFCAPFCPF